MSNAIFQWSLALILLPRVILAGPHSTASLSPYLTNNVPTCAHRCLESYIADNFRSPACRDQQDLNCLCTSKSASGLTLGEEALSCAASYCSNSVFEASVDVYELCAHVNNARPMTHGTLTATQVIDTTIALTSHSRTTTFPHSIRLPYFPPSSVTLSSSTHSSSSLPTAITIAKSLTTAITTATSLPTVTITATSLPTLSISSPVSLPLAPHTTHKTPVYSSSTTSKASPASSSATSKPQPVLTKPQIAGVTVAGVASAALAFGVLFCIFCLRRKDKKRRNSGSSFGGDNIIPSRPGSPGLPAAGAVDPEHGDRSFGDGGAQERKILTPENFVSRWSFWGKSTKPEEIGVAVGPEMMHSTPPTRHGPSRDEAPASAGSYRTTSQLLPDKPTYSLFPQPLRVVNPSTSPVSPQSPDSTETRFTDVAGAGPSGKPAPRGRNAFDTSQRSLQQVPKGVRTSTSDPFLDSHSEPQGLVFSESHSGVGMSPWTRSLEIVRKPVPARGPPGAQYSQPSAIRSKPSLQIPSTYAGRPTYGVRGQSSVPDQSWGSAAKRRNSFARPATHYSTASDTSFEDAGEEDDAPTAHPVLSPVVESPGVRSPPGQVRYPKIPVTIPPLNTRRALPETPTRRPPPKNPKRAIVAQANKGKTVPIPQPEVAELYGSPVSPKAQWSSQPHSRESLKGSTNGNRDSSAPSAKWQILVKPGLEGLEGASSPKAMPTSSPRSGKTGESRVSDRSEESTPLLTPTKRRGGFES